MRAESVGVFRHVNVRLMETLAAWIPTTPEMEVKVLFGRHLWLAAQLADRLGRRSRELRAPLHYGRPPAPAFAGALDGLESIGPTGARIEAFYHDALPALDRAYADYLQRTDALIDEPTVVILRDAVRDIERMQGEVAQVLEEFPALRAGPPATRPFADAGQILADEHEAQSA